MYGALKINPELVYETCITRFVRHKGEGKNKRLRQGESACGACIDKGAACGNPFI